MKLSSLMMLTSRILAILSFVILASQPVFAQATATSKIQFDQSSTDLATANSYTYKYYPDGSATGINLSVVCTGTSSPFTCTAAMPAFTPGSHSIEITASNVAGESAKSAPIKFTFVVVPSAPTNLQILSN